MAERFRDLVGREVRLVSDLHTNGGTTFPKGTVMLVDSHWRGVFMLSLVEPGEGGRRATIRRVHRSDFEPVESTKEEAVLDPKSQDPNERCAGCGKEFPRKYYHLPYATVKVGWDHSVKVCLHGSHTNRYAKQSCVTAVRARLKLCPGCNTENTVPGTICFECEQKLSEAKRPQGSAPQPYVLPALALFENVGDAHIASREDLREKSVALLATMLGGALDRSKYGSVPTLFGRYDLRHSGDPAVLLTDEQAAALKEFVGLWQKVFKLQRAEGREEGHSFIVELAAGKVSMDEFNEHDAAVKKAKAEAERALQGEEE